MITLPHFCVFRLFDKSKKMSVLKIFANGRKVKINKQKLVWAGFKKIIKNLTKRVCIAEIINFAFLTNQIGLSKKK